MKSIARALAGLLALAGLTLSAHAEISSADQQTFRGLISNQIAAFQHDDSAGAYSYASPTIKGIFPTAEMFMSMVKQGYMPVYRPQSVTFGEVVETPEGPVQKVYITGPDGKDYLAAYSLQRHPDGSWLINGCAILQADGPSI